MPSDANLPYLCKTKQHSFTMKFERQLNSPGLYVSSGICGLEPVKRKNFFELRSSNTSRTRKEETAENYRQVIGTNHSSNKLTRRLFDCTDRRESKELFLAIEKLHKRKEGILRKCDEEINDLQNILHKLELEREGSVPFRKLIEGDEVKLKSSHETQGEGVCLDIKSIRRPLVPLTPRNHGIQVRVNHELLSKACAVPHRIRSKIVRREAVRLNKMEKWRLWHPGRGTHTGFGISGQLDAHSSSGHPFTNTDYTIKAKSGFKQGNEGDEFLVCSGRNKATFNDKAEEPGKSSSESKAESDDGYSDGEIPNRGNIHGNIPQIRIIASNDDSPEAEDKRVEVRPPSFPGSVTVLGNPQSISERRRSRHLSVSKLQTIVHENVLSPRTRDFTSKQKAKQLVDYQSMLRQQLGTDDRPNLTKADSQYLRLTGRRDSPDFTDTPFINVGKNAVIERDHEENVFKNVAKLHKLESLVALRNQLSGIPATVSFPRTVDDSRIQRINARLPAYAVGSAAGVIITDKTDRFDRLRRRLKEAH